ncbi:MAG: ADP-ribosylglycohydrolase family protein [Lentisphaeria bacterium]|nr:ADP-ribosylglycohydrolase family protein [Lentisphaeria bacterium]
MSYHSKMSARATCLTQWLDLKKEQGADTEALEQAFEAVLDDFVRKAHATPGDAGLATREPDDLEAIRALRPHGPRVIRRAMSSDILFDRIRGAWLGRAAGCVLGIPCEGMSRDQIATACTVSGQKYPLTGYWLSDPKPGQANGLHYGVTPRKRFLQPWMRDVGADDDLAYTQLGLLILQEHGLDFTSANVGEAWLRYLPTACTAEKVALQNLKDGMVPPETARTDDNPFAEWIGADIRSDPWGYAAPGCPERAAEFAWRDARVSHVRNGIYGEMYFSAVIATALVEDSGTPAASVERSLEAGLAEIPKHCRMAETVRETMEWCREESAWKETVGRILVRYRGMSPVHTLNNAALTIAGLMYGRGRFGPTIGLTVSAGLDTDCTAATAGSILGAILGAKRLPARWRTPLGKSSQTYIIGRRRFGHDTVARSFLRIAQQTRAACGVAL